VDAIADLTVSQKILLAAHRLEEGGHSPFTAEALTVAAWKGDARTFGLRGFDNEYPDNNRVLACIMGERGLARRVLAGDDSPLPKRRALAKIQVPRELEQQLVSMFSTTAFRR